MPSGGVVPIHDVERVVRTARLERRMVDSAKLSKQTSENAELRSWQGAVTQLLDEHHILAWDDGAEARDRFAEAMVPVLAGLPDTQVGIIPGQQVRDLYSFCAALERAIGAERVRRSVYSRHGVVDALRAHPPTTGGHALKRRYVVWLDAHVLLGEDRELFELLVGALLGTAAESEYVSDDVLLLQRSVFVGDGTLKAYASAERSAMREWIRSPDGPDWKKKTGVDGPAVLNLHLSGTLPNASMGALPPGRVVIPSRAARKVVHD